MLCHPQVSQPLTKVAVDRGCSTGKRLVSQHHPHVRRELNTSSGILIIPLKLQMWLSRTGFSLAERLKSTQWISSSFLTFPDLYVVGVPIVLNWTINPCRNQISREFNNLGKIVYRNYSFVAIVNVSLLRAGWPVSCRSGLNPQKSAISTRESALVKKPKGEKVVTRGISQMSPTSVRK